MEEAVRMGGEGLRSLEVRIVPGQTLQDNYRTIRTIQRVTNRIRSERGDRTSRLEVGVIYHFPRTRGRNAERGTPFAFSRASHGDPGHQRFNPSGYRYESFFRDWKASAVSLATMFQSFPQSLRIVRGVDLCSDELAVPLWVMIPLIDYVRRGASLARRRLLRRDHRYCSLRTTIHAGEDYVHLLGGIRRVDEVVEYLDLREGDRIGHGVALGMDPIGWCCDKANLAIPKGERLLDLIWVWKMLSNPSEGDGIDQVPWLIEELARLSNDIFYERITPSILLQMVDLLHHPVCLYRLGFPDGRVRALSRELSRFIPRLRRRSRWSNNINLSWRLARQWLTSRGVFRRSQEVEWLDVRREAALVKHLQEQVRRSIGRRGIVVEINPSSNLLIGHLGDLEQHPLWRLRPPRGRGEAPPVSVCIGSDDPITFATTLPEEYQLLHDAMVSAGLSADECDTWLEATRNAGLASRFTID